MAWPEEWGEEEVNGIFDDFSMPSGQPGVPGTTGVPRNIVSNSSFSISPGSGQTMPMPVDSEEFKKEIARLEELVKALTHRVDDLERGV